MSNITLQIGGRAYTVACDEGQEGHVSDLGTIVAEKIQSIGASGHNEVRQLLFAALMLADELHEARKALAAANPDSHAATLEALAGRLENIAAHLES